MLTFMHQFDELKSSMLRFVSECHVILGITKGGTDPTFALEPLRPYTVLANLRATLQTTGNYAPTMCGSEEN
jgi:hypothetical protein